MTAHIEIPLSQGLVSLVDIDDYAAVIAAGPWYANRDCRTFYARHNRVVGPRKWATTTIHGLITGWPLVDHRNGDGLDNRRANLRPATEAQNRTSRRRRLDNTSGYKGVSWHKASRRWVAAIAIRGRNQHLGSFDDPIAAAMAYDAAAVIQFGEWSRLNFPEEHAA